MGVLKKFKRRITISGRDYYWYVKKEDELFGHLFLSVVSEDKKFAISYLLDSQLLIVQGKDFNGVEDTGHQWKWIEVQFDNQKIITPGFVEKLVDWCISPKDAVNYLDSNYLSAFGSVALSPKASISADTNK